MVIVLLVVCVLAFTLSKVLSHAPTETGHDVQAAADAAAHATGPAAPKRSAAPVETRWTAWDDHQVARLLEDTPPTC